MTYNEAETIKKCIKLLSQSGSNTKLQVQNILVGMLTEQPKNEKEQRYKMFEEFLDLTEIVETDTNIEVVFWKDKDYEYAKAIIKQLKEK